MSESQLLPRGMYRDRIVTASQCRIDRGWQSNRIVDRCRTLIAGFMRGDRSVGIRQLQIGRGLEAWDDAPPEAPPATVRQLTDPSPFVVRLTRQQISYLDPSGVPTHVPTNRLEIVVTLAGTEPPLRRGERDYAMREFGLFGEFGGEAFMINYVRHPVLRKQAGDTLTRSIRLAF